VETAAQTIVEIVRRMRLGDRAVQLVMSFEMIDTVERVLVRVGAPPEKAVDFAASLVELMKAGPLQLDPTLLLSGRDQIAIRDREDSGVLATAIAARADLLVTDNLRDFVTRDAETVTTGMIAVPTGERRRFAIFHERADHVSLVVAHPIDVLAWARAGIDISIASLREMYG
jgi:predicted nucleic acid-binding protein